MSNRLHTAAFVLLCVAGALAAVVLTVHQITQTAPVSLKVTHAARAGEVTLVTVSVSNRTGSSRCVSVRIAARDQAGHDLAAVTAAQSLDLPPHGRRTAQADLRLTPRQYAEQLHAFYPSQRPCASERSH